MNPLCNVVGVLQRLLRRIWHDDEYTDAPIFPWQSLTCSFTIFFFGPHCIVPIMIGLLATDNDHSIRMSDNTLRIQIQGHGQGFPTSCYFIFSCLNSSRVYIMILTQEQSVCMCLCISHGFQFWRPEHNSNAMNNMEHQYAGHRGIFPALFPDQLSTLRIVLLGNIFATLLAWPSNDKFVWLNWF